MQMTAAMAASIYGPQISTPNIIHPKDYTHTYDSKHPVLDSVKSHQSINLPYTHWTSLTRSLSHDIDCIRYDDTHT
jgi:hypothetical protein